MANDRHVVAIFDNRVKAQDALDALVESGIPSDKLSMLISQNGRDHHFEVDKEKSKTAEGVGYGAALGGLLGGLTAVGAGLVSVTVPGAIFVTGPLAVALTTGAVGAAVGGLAGGLIGVGIPADEVKLVEKDLGKGDIVLAAHSLTSDDVKLATQIFRDAGAARVH